MLKKTTISVLLLFVFVSCKDNKTAQKTNPLMQKSTLPFQAPPFDKIKPSDFLPAFKKGMEKQRKEVKKIAVDTAAPTFQNTFVALEKSGQMLTRVRQDFGILTSADTNPELQDIQQKVSPELAAHFDAIYLNPKLFQRVKTIYENRKNVGLDHESQRLVKYYYKKFVRAGADLPEKDKAKLKKLNEKAASLSTQFTNKLLAATKDGALVVDDTTKLRGLSENQIKAARQDAENRDLSDKWIIPLQNTTQQPDLAELKNREVRKKLFEHSWNRAEKSDSNDTRATIKELAEVRAKKAKLLGYPDYAAWKLQNQMAKNPQTVDHFLQQLVKPTKAAAKAETAELQKIINQKDGHFKLQPYDWNYYAQFLKKKKFALNTDSIRPYFELNNVLKNGVFYAANQLYGITFKERHDIPVWHKGVRVFDVYDKDGSSLGMFYCDYFKRDNKSGGAWMSNLVTQSRLLHQKPVIYNVANFPKPASGEPALLTFEQVTTMFHEFGHALHGFFADQEYPSLSGTQVARDFVEFPSQFNEHWALNPKVLKHYAIHYKTGKPMPQELVDKIKKTAHFNEGYLFTELLEAALLDMQWHTIPASQTIQNVDSFEVKALKNAHIYLPKVPPRYRSSYFMHIWGNGYAAGYYAYLWTEMLADDAFDWFQNHGGMTLENGQRFRDKILSRGHTESYQKMFKDFTGHKPEISPMLKDLGFK
jgi:peptidyl-dipeptidase Dcp